MGDDLLRWSVCSEHCHLSFVVYSRRDAAPSTETILAGWGGATSPRFAGALGSSQAELDLRRWWGGGVT